MSRERTIAEVERDLSDADLEISGMTETIKSQEREIRELESKVSRLEDSEPDFSELTDEDFIDQFVRRFAPSGSLFAEMKMEAVVKHFNSFTVEQFEEFISSKKS